MDLQEQHAAARGGMAGGKAGRGDSDRRSSRRYVVDCPALLVLLAGATHLKCHLVDLSLGGCRLTAEQRFQPGIHVRVEVQFSLRGIAFRAFGVTMGSRGGSTFAIRFLDMPKRRQEELAEVLSEEDFTRAAVLCALGAPLELAQAPGAARQSARESQAADPAAKPMRGDANLPGMQGRVGGGALGSKTHRNPATAGVKPNPQTGKGLEAEKPVDRRKYRRLSVHTRMKLLLVKAGISMPGIIVNLSEGGCRLQTEEPFQLGIYVRVETSSI